MPSPILPSLAWTTSRRLIVLAALVAPLAAAAAPQPPSPTGEWLTEKGVATIRVVDCNGDMWGVVASEQSPGTDKNNPDPRLRSRPTLGMPVLMGMKQTEPNKWSGDIYNSQDGRTYSANISLLNPDTLKVQGCVLGFLCGGENWSRVQPDKASPAGKPTGSTPARTAATAKPATPAKPQAKPPAGPSASVSAPPPNPQTATSEEICSGLVGLAGSAHERRLK